MDDAIHPLFVKWQFFFSLFDRIIEHKTADYRHPPFDTDWANQPYKTMQILDYLRELWIERLNDEQQKQEQKMKR